MASVIFLFAPVAPESKAFNARAKRESAGAETLDVINSEIIDAEDVEDMLDAVRTLELVDDDKTVATEGTLDGVITLQLVDDGDSL